MKKVLVCLCVLCLFGCAGADAAKTKDNIGLIVKRYKVNYVDKSGDYLDLFYGYDVYQIGKDGKRQIKKKATFSRVRHEISQDCQVSVGLVIRRVKGEVEGAISLASNPVCIKFKNKGFVTKDINHNDFKLHGVKIEKNKTSHIFGLNSDEREKICKESKSNDCVWNGRYAQGLMFDFEVFSLSSLNEHVYGVAVYLNGELKVKKKTSQKSNSISIRAQKIISSHMPYDAELSFEIFPNSEGYDDIQDLVLQDKNKKLKALKLVLDSFGVEDVEQALICLHRGEQTKFYSCLLGFVSGPLINKAKEWQLTDEKKKKILESLKETNANIDDEGVKKYSKMLDSLSRRLNDFLGGFYEQDGSLDVDDVKKRCDQVKGLINDFNALYKKPAERIDFRFKCELLGDVSDGYDSYVSVLNTVDKAKKAFVEIKRGDKDRVVSVYNKLVNKSLLSQDQIFVDRKSNPEFEESISLRSVYVDRVQRFHFATWNAYSFNSGAQALVNSVDLDTFVPVVDFIGYRYLCSDVVDLRVAVGGAFMLDKVKVPFVDGSVEEFNKFNGGPVLSVGVNSLRIGVGYMVMGHGKSQYGFGYSYSSYGVVSSNAFNNIWLDRMRLFVGVDLYSLITSTPSGVFASPSTVDVGD